MGAVGEVEVGTPAAHIRVMDSWMSVMALVSVLLVATRFLILDGGILLNGCVCQIVKRRSRLLCLVQFVNLICTKCCVAGSHAIDVMHFGKGGGPVGLPVGPNVANRWAMFPLAPGQRHVATC